MINETCVRTPNGVDNILCLTTRVSEAKDINFEKYENIDSPEIEFEAEIFGDEKYYENTNNCPAPKKLRFKVGMQVLFTANDPDKRFVNGTIAEIIAIN